MSRVFAVICLSAAVATYTVAVPSGVSPGSDSNIVSCKEGSVSFDLADCNSITNNNIVGSVFSISIPLTCNMTCTNNSTCYSIKVLSSKGQSSPPPEIFRCCTAEDNCNHVNCGSQQCSATSTCGSTANTGCCTKCTKSQALLI